MVSEITVIPNSSMVAVNRWRIVWGTAFLFIGTISGSAVGVLWSWASSYTQSQILYYVMTDWQLIYCAFIVSGLTAAVGIAILVPPLIRCIPRRWVRRLSGIAVSLTIFASAALWLVFLPFFFVKAFGHSYTKVSAENGQSVVVKWGGFKPKSYQVYNQRSSYIYEYYDGGVFASRHTTGSRGSFDPDTCVLDSNNAGLLLTCGDEVVRIPNSSR